MRNLAFIIFIIYRSHAGAVEKLARKSFGEGYKVEPAGGSGYKTLRLVNGTAGEVMVCKFNKFVA